MLLGVVVGTAIVAQTLYASTKEHLNEFATLRAIGSSRGYIYKVIVWQAATGAVIGFVIAAGVALGVVYMTAGSALPIVITPVILAALFVLSLVMCIGASLAAILRVMRVDPASAFTR
jgi:putative ABC transport system permease protein